MYEFAPTSNPVFKNAQTLGMEIVQQQFFPENNQSKNNIQQFKIEITETDELLRTSAEKHLPALKIYTETTALRNEMSKETNQLPGIVNSNKWGRAINGKSTYSDIAECAIEIVGAITLLKLGYRYIPKFGINAFARRSADNISDATEISSSLTKLPQTLAKGIRLGERPSYPMPR